MTSAISRRIRRIGVVVPAHNEAGLIAACLAAIDRAARHAALEGIEVRTHVVCDACSDDTAVEVLASGHMPLVIDARSVGVARAAGAAQALADGAQWLAFTDADTRVADDWLVAQLVQGTEVVCGTVGVDDWGPYGTPMQLHFAGTYQDIDGHRHIHGANLGIAADAYRRVGGFAAIDSEEDVAIVTALEGSGATIAWSAAPRVVTSARADYRAPGGFGATLARVAAGTFGGRGG